MCAASLGCQGDRQTVVAGGKTSSGSIPNIVGCVLLLLAGEASERQTVVAGGVVRPLAVKASGNSIPEMAGYLMLLALSVTNKVGLNVIIQNKKNNKGKITIEYKDLDQLNKIVEIIKSNY